MTISLLIVPLWPVQSIAGADYIVSEDSHFEILKTIPFPSVTVKHLDDFLRDLDSL